MIGRSTATPRFARNIASKQKELYHSPCSECLDDRAGRRLDFRSRFAYFNAGDSSDLLSQSIGGIYEQLAVELLYLRGALRALGQSPLRRRQGAVQRDRQRVVTQNHRHRFGRMSRAPLLERNGRLRNLLRHTHVGLDHRVCPSGTDVVDEGKKKPTWSNTSGIRPRRPTRQRAFQLSLKCSSPSRPTT